MSRPYGSWSSRLTPEVAAGGALRVSAIALDRAVDGSTIVRWSEQRPELGGRTVVCRDLVPDGSPDEGRQPAGRSVIEGPADMSARSGVNEYGGGSWWGDGERLFWVDGPSAAIVVIDRPGAPVRRVTTVAGAPHSLRHASGSLTPDGAWIVCEREVHRGAVLDPHDEDPGSLDEPLNELAVVATAGGPSRTLLRDGDWAVAPAVSPDGTGLAWLRWSHPDMPWDAAEVWAGRLVVPDASTDDDPGEAVPEVLDARRVAGGRAGAAAHHLDRPVAACLPRWSPDGHLWWCDDAADWWHLRRAPEPGIPAEGAGDHGPPTLDVPGEVGEPRWITGGARYGFTGDGRVVVALQRDGLDSVQVWDPATGSVEPVPAPDGGFSAVEHLAVLGDVVAVAGGGGSRPASAWTVDLGSGTVTDHRGTAAPDPADVSMPTPITFPTGGGEQAHALFYEPRSATAVGPDDALPPLVVRIHGGPTASARAEYSTSIQFWTTRGFAVVDVNYRGSTGFGRRYRDLLAGEWGVVDVEDCVAAVRWLADQGLVDGRRCVIRGGSSGGFTALEATCRSEAFAAACSLYGVTDLRALADDTHKFESRYLDGLVGRWPEEADRYRERSPLFHAQLLDRPVLLLQGVDDPIVPPAQARVLRDALRDNGVPHALILFDGEAHGFRSAGTIVRALEAELAFYGQVLGFVPADPLPELALDG